MRVLIPASLFLLAIGGSPALAEIEPLTRGEQIELADLIVTGTVRRVFKRADDPALRMVRLHVDHVEKGAGPRRGALLHAGFRIGERGQTKPPRVGQSARLFLARNDEGGWELLTPNGSEPASKPAVQPSARALERLEGELKGLIAAVRSGDKKLFAQRVNGFRIPQPERWFRRVFGHGAKGLIAEYAQWRPKLAGRFRRVIQKAIDSGDTTMVVHRAEGWRAIGVQRRASFAMQREVRLYTVKFPKAGEELWSFAEVGGRFRWVGKLRALPSREPLVVKIELSAARIDPGKLDACTLEVVIVNESTKVVDEVPTVYDGTSVSLQGRGLNHLWAQRLKLEVRPKQVYAPLKPNERRVVLKTTLQALFKPRPRSNRSWDWGSHPVPPASPIHRWREAGYEPSARLVMRVWAGRRTLFSKPVVLTLERN